jgi:hypothetical protein
LRKSGVTKRAPKRIVDELRGVIEGQFAAGPYIDAADVWHSLQGTPLGRIGKRETATASSRAHASLV